MGDFSIVDSNLRVALRFFGHATGSGSVDDLNGITAISSGLDYGVFNIALLSEPVRGARMLQARLAECGQYYASRKQSWSFWLCEDLLDAHALRAADEIGAGQGMRVISQAPAWLRTGLLRHPGLFLRLRSGQSQLLDCAPTLRS